MERCKTCGREYTPVRTMTYSDYGYCSWDCLMNKKSRHNNNNHHSNQNKSNRRPNGPRNEAGTRSKWAQNY